MKPMERERSGVGVGGGWGARRCGWDLWTLSRHKGNDFHEAHDTIAEATLWARRKITADASVKQWVVNAIEAKLWSQQTCWRCTLHKGCSTPGLLPTANIMANHRGTHTHTDPPHPTPNGVLRLQYLFGHGLAAAAPMHGQVTLGTQKVARTWTGARTQTTQRHFLRPQRLLAWPGAAKPWPNK